MNLQSEAESGRNATQNLVKNADENLNVKQDMSFEVLW